MPEMNDPVLDRLAKFTPEPGGVDAAELLFAAGRASARTPWFWKAAAAGLLLTNLVCVAVLLLRSPEPGPLPWPLPMPVPAVLPAADPSPPSEAPPAGDVPWSYRSLLSVSDPDQLPKLEFTPGDFPAGRPLTPLAGRRGESD